jgi:hypothetical protein
MQEKAGRVESSFASVSRLTGLSHQMRDSLKSYPLLFLLFLASLAQAELPLSIVGTFEATQPSERKSEQRFLMIKITESVARYFLSGRAGFSTGRPPRLEFSGSGYPSREPPFKFSLEDSFGNKGVASITPTKSGITFSATINETEDRRCLIFYKATELKRVARSQPL